MVWVEEMAVLTSIVGVKGYVETGNMLKRVSVLRCMSQVKRSDTIPS